MKDPRAKFSEFIASMIRYEIQDHGVNCVDEQELDKFEKKIQRLVATHLKGLKMEDKRLNIDY